MKIWRSSLFCLEFVFCRVCLLLKKNLSIHDWFVLSRMENLWISMLLFIFLVDSSYILKSPRPRKPSPSPMGPVGRGRDRWGWCWLRVFMGFVLRFTSWWGRRDVKRKCQTNYNPSLCLWFFALHFRALWNTDHLNLKNYTFTCWMDCFKANCLLFSHRVHRQLIFSELILATCSSSTYFFQQSP